MRVLIQRVKRASVEVDEKIIASIGQGLLILIGIEEADGNDDITWLCNKICGSNHFNMQMKIIVETEEEYDAWLAEQAPLAVTLKN